MKLQRLSLIILLSVIFGFCFSSCERWDYYWIPGTLDNTITSNVSGSGIIKTEFRVSADQIYTENRRLDMHDLTFKSGFANLERRYAADRIYGIRLTLAGTNVYVDLSGEDGEYNSFQVQSFLNEVTNDVRNYGFATILVDGEARPGTVFTLGLFMDLDVYVRE